MVRLSTTEGIGTGWVYEPGWLVTAAHVVAGNHAQVTVEYTDAQGSYKTASGFVRGRDHLRDIAAIEVDIDLPVLPAEDGIYTADTSKPVMSLGYSSDPPAGWPNVRAGVVTTSFLIVEHDLAVFEVDAQFDPGDSGGPVVDLEGHVVGVSQASKTRTTSLQRIQGQQLVLNIREVQEIWSQLKGGAQINVFGPGYWWESQ